MNYKIILIVASWLKIEFVQLWNAMVTQRYKHIFE